MISRKMIRSFTVLDTDGNHVSISETIEQNMVVISIQQNDEKGRITTARLDREQWIALCDLRYDVKVNEKEEEIAPTQEPTKED